MITKKMIAAIKKSDGFLIPNFETGKGFLSIKNGKEFNIGLVVYTGVGLDGNSIIEKINEYDTIKYSWIKNSDIFDRYLIEIKNLKISKHYSLVLVENDFKFEMKKKA